MPAMRAVHRLSARSTLPFHTDPLGFHAPPCGVLVPRPRLEYASLRGARWFARRTWNLKPPFIRALLGKEDGSNE